MSITLIIDTRESQLQQLIPDASIEALDVGDIVFRKGTESILIIERKSAADLSASIIDKRGPNQKARLLNSGTSRERVMFLIEGNFNKPSTTKIGSLPISTLLGSMINTQFRDGVRIYKTSCIEETAEFIKKLHQKLNKDGDDFWKYMNETEGMSAGNYSATLKKSKKANMTPEVWMISQLSLIPQVTETIASVIVNVYPSIHKLMSEYEKLPEHLRPKLLIELTYTLPAGKTRKIGPRLSERIYYFLYGFSEKD